MKYVYDCNTLNCFSSCVVIVYAQESIQPLTHYDLVKELQSYSDVCEALYTIQLALGFLAMTGGEPHMQLATYLKEVLQMTDHMGPHIYKVGHEHTLSSLFSVTHWCQEMSWSDVFLSGGTRIKEYRKTWKIWVSGDFPLLPSMCSVCDAGWWKRELFCFV